MKIKRKDPGMDNRREAEFLLSDAGLSEIALTLADAILEIEETKPI